MTRTYLDDIVAWHRRRSQNDSRSLDELLAEAKSCVPTRGFASSIRATPHLAVIAEIKRRSPSKGDLNASLDPADLALQYQRGGASCLSVLTDNNHFGGSVSELQLDEAELDVAMRAGATMVGVNQRDLVTFAVDQARAVRMAPLIPNNVVKVAESGVRGRDDAIALRAAGYDAILVGEHLVTSPNPEAALSDLCVDNEAH